MRALVVVLVLMVSACAVVQPKVDECMAYDTDVKTSYCYVSKEVEAVIRATAQSKRDGVITNEQAVVIANAMRKADEYLDMAERFILVGDDVQATGSLDAARLLLLEVK